MIYIVVLILILVVGFLFYLLSKEKEMNNVLINRINDVEINNAYKELTIMKLKEKNMDLYDSLYKKRWFNTVLGGYYEQLQY